MQFRIIWTVQSGHQLLESIEADIRHTLPSVTVFTPLESLNDSASWDDTSLARKETPPLDPLARIHNHPLRKVDGEA
jgi:hypothetical protein